MELIVPTFTLSKFSQTTRTSSNSLSFSYVHLDHRSILPTTHIQPSPPGASRFYHCNVNFDPRLQLATSGERRVDTWAFRMAISG
ncbi:uncharacterized protein RAG0_13096 [Rhynchosporium agropyri]|uniref:Uncharacterized protein n=1 Tax=Rhynchosporium agropyri TaxID=914238 RepID=A0A1E1LB94_9HELO|nr:uncharacterized protein RAG0_13096 [Rhynchosporium agropyri]